jgi:hypothetical protein
MDARNNIATDLFYKIRSRFSGLKLGSETGEITIIPEDARFFDFNYMEGGKPIGHVSISLAEPNSMKIYFSTGITENMETVEKHNWYRFLKEMRQFAKRRLLSFDTRDIAKDNLDKRDYAFLTKNAVTQPAAGTAQPALGESVMNESAMYGTKTMSYQKLMDTRLIIKHNQTVMDDTQPGARTRNISALFVENQDGERFKYPFIHLAGARAMQRHVANGGVPYDDIGKSIISMSEEIAQLKSFGNYVVRNDLMNSQNNSIVERSADYLNNLREQIHKLSKQSHYEAYKENFQARSSIEVPQEVVEDFTEKFTVKNFKEDIKSVFPVLYRLMQEENSIGYNDIVEMTTEIETNEDVEIDLSPDSPDPFEAFESWIMELGEVSPIDSEDPEEQKQAIIELQELMGQEFPVGINGENAITSLEGIIKDSDLLQQLKELSSQDEQADARPVVKQWLEQKAPEVLSQITFGDLKQTAEAQDYDYDDERDNPKVTQELAKIKNPLKFDSEDQKIYQLIIAKFYPDDEEVRSAEHEFEMDGLGNIIDANTGKQLSIDDLHYDQSTSVGVTSNMVNQWMDKQDFDLDAIRQEVESNVADDDSYQSDPSGYYGVSNRDFFNPRESAEEPTASASPKINVRELAEFIQSFYDKEANTFPKGPEGVCVMVGKKFGEQAEQVARKFVERLAPEQTMTADRGNDQEDMELNRIKQLSGITQGIMQ